MPKRIVLIGGPSTGKTTLIKQLEQLGHPCMHEVSREVTKAAQEEGIEQLFLTKPLLFSEKLLEGRISQFSDAGNLNENYVFLDRGIPDVLAYMDYLNQEYPPRFIEACQKYMYDQVFILPIWKEIHETDGERYEDFDQAAKIQDYLKRTYLKYGYDPIAVPKTSVEERSQYILDRIQ